MNVNVRRYSRKSHFVHGIDSEESPVWVMNGSYKVFTFAV